MARYSMTANLVSSTVEVDERGNACETRDYKKVFVNIFSVGATERMAARSAGLKADGEIRLRSCDYEGEQMVEMGRCRVRHRGRQVRG